MTAAGGSLTQRPPGHGHGHARGAEPAARYPLAVPISGLVAIAVLTPLHASWDVQLLLVPLLLIIPGIILLRALRVSCVTIADNPIYVPAAAIVVLTFCGLAIDLLGPLAGISAPLLAAPLLVTLEIVCAALLLISLDVPPEVDIPWGGLIQSTALGKPAALAWPLILPVVAAAGALRLNSGHSDDVAMIAIVLVIIVLVVGFLRAPRFGESLLIVILFAAGLALMWSFSLRGDLVYGFDISNEYYSLNQTVTAGVWQLAHPNDAYGAMLSVTVLPAELHALTGIPALFIFKIIYPIIGALFPVGVFTLARRLLTGRWAFMAAALVIMQETFFQQLTALARQEIAILLFTALIAVILDTEQPRRGRWIFACLLSLGMVVSHYSTTYMAIPLLAMAVAFQWVASWFRQVPRVSGTVLLAFVVSLAGAVAWYGPLTQSATNMSQFVQSVREQGVSLLPNQGSSLLSTYLQGEASQELSPSQYQSYISSYYQKTYPFITPLPDAGAAQYDLKPVSDATPPIRLAPIADGVSLAGLLVQQMTNLLAGIGAIVLALRRKRQPFATQIGLLGIAAMIILVLTRLSGTIAEAYNPQRAFLQCLVVVSIAICWLFQRLGARRKRMRPWVLTGCAAALALFLVGATGLSGLFFGGGTAANLADQYDDYNQFVVNTQDLAAADWLVQEAPSDEIIEADRYGELRLQTMVGDRSAMFGDVTPQTIDQNAWVYATRANLVDGVAESETGNYSATYAFPRLFLDSNFNVVYTDGTSEVFHR